MTLTSTQGPITAVLAVLNAHLPTGWEATDQPALDVNRVLVEPVTSPNPETFTLGGLPERSTVLLQVTGHARNRAHSVQAADLVRTILTGHTGRKPTNPLELAGYLFAPVKTLGDLRLTLVNGLHTFTETYRITWQTTPQSGS